MNGASILILIIIAVCFAFAVKKVIDDKNNGCSGCNGCGGCSSTRCRSYRNIEVANKENNRTEKQDD